MNLAMSFILPGLITLFFWTVSCQEFEENEMPPDYKYEYEYEYDYSNNDITNPPESLETVQTQPTIPVASDVPLLPTEDKKIIPDHRRGLKKPKMKMDSKIRRIQMPWPQPKDLGSAVQQDDGILDEDISGQEIIGEVDVDHSQVDINRTGLGSLGAVDPTISLAVDLDVAVRQGGGSAEMFGSQTPEGNSTKHLRATLHMDRHLVQEIRALINADFHWSKWGRWSHCTVTCGGGGWRVRHRHCGDGPPEMCPNSDVSTSACPVSPPCAGLSAQRSKKGHAAKWTDWSVWSECSVTCGTGRESQTRRCVTSAQNTSVGCEGKRERFRHCVRHACQIDGSTSVTRVLEGHEVRLHCQFDTSRPYLEMYWVTPHGQRIEPDQHDNRYHVEGNYLTVSHAEDYDVGGYHCVVTRPNERNETTDVNLALYTCTFHNLCQHGGSCVEMPETPERPYPYLACVCVTGYTGQFCEQRSNKALLTYLSAVSFVVSLVILTLLIAFRTRSVRRVRISRDKSQSKEEPLLSTVEDPPDNEENDVDPGLLNPDQVIDPKSFSDLAQRPLPDKPDDEENAYVNIAPRNSEWNARDPLLANESDLYMTLGDPLDHTYAEAGDISQRPGSIGTSVRVHTSTPKNSPSAESGLNEPWSKDSQPESISRPRPTPTKGSSPAYPGPPGQPNMGISSLGTLPSLPSMTEYDDSNVYADMTQANLPPQVPTRDRRLTLTGTDPGSPMYPWSPRAARSNRRDSIPVDKNKDFPVIDAPSTEDLSPWRSPRGPHPDDRHVELNEGSDVVQGTSPRVPEVPSAYKQVVNTIKTITEIRDLLIQSSPEKNVTDNPNNMTCGEINEILASPHAHKVQNETVHNVTSFHADDGDGMGIVGASVSTKTYTVLATPSGVLEKQSSTVPAGGLRMPGSPSGSPRKRLFESTTSLDGLVDVNQNNHNTTDATEGSCECIGPELGETDTTDQKKSPRKVNSQEDVRDSLLALWKESMHL